MKYEKSCGCIVINNKKEVLLIHHNAGHWDFPKGHMEEGETEIDTALREVKEETNLDVKINNNYRYKTIYSPKENVEKEVIYFLANNISENIKPQIEEISELKWIKIEDAIDEITYDNSKNIFKQLIERLKEEGNL